MTPVVSLVTWILVVPIAIVNGNLHLRSVSIVHAIAALIRFWTAEVLWIEDVRVVVKSVAIAAVPGAAP